MSKLDSSRTEEVSHKAIGGTIDAAWAPAEDTATPSDHTIIPMYLDAVRLPGHEVTSETLTLDDSRDIDNDVQRLIAAKVCESPDKRIIGTSGTYLMPNIADRISRHPSTKHFDRLDRKLVMTGSLVPIRGYSMSDGGFNLGMSVAVLQEDTGARVMIVMNGLCLDVGKGVQKDLKRARFEANDGTDLMRYDDVNIILAGGSMDFVPDGLDGMVPAKSSAVPEFLRSSVNYQKNFDAETPFVKDSRDLAEDDMEVILNSVRGATSGQVLVTAGIYKIREIQKFLQENLKGEDANRRVVLTGSRMPLRSEPMTDATFNLGYSLGKMGYLEDGVHVALNGMIMEEGDDIIKLLYTEREIQRLRVMNAIS